jgi:hypothetical protein
MATQAFETIENTGDWAAEEFGAAVLGNKLRTQRLVWMADRAAETPDGRVAAVFPNSAEREGAYRLLENLNFSDRDAAEAAHESCARRCQGQSFVFVAVDGCTLSVTDTTGAKGFGKVGTRATRARGIEVMNAMAVDPEGTPLGVCSQIWWTRRDTPVSEPSRNREFHEKETRYWLHCMDAVNAAFDNVSSTTTRWYQLDAGADFAEMLCRAAQSEQLVTVRSAQDRIVEGELGLLWGTVESSPSLGTMEVPVPRGGKRQARTAVLEVRSIPVTIRLPRGLGSATLNAVLTLEIGTTPPDEEPITWLLITNADVDSFADAKQVVFGYTQRWRVEEFHKSWKSVCKVEKSQLDVLPFKLWATVLASVAMRIERLKYLARNQPEEPATIELCENEIQAIVVLKDKKPRDYDPEKVPTIAQAVRWIAELGGYTGKQSGGPPGTIVIGRGLRDVEIAARVLVNIHDST